MSSKLVGLILVTDSLLSDLSKGGSMSSSHLCIANPAHSVFSVGFSVDAEMVTDEMIQRAIYSTRDTLGQVLEFVAELDERQVPRSYGYFVELEGELGVCYTLARHPSTRFKLTSNFQDLILTLLHAKCKLSFSRIQGTRWPLTTEGLVCPPSEFLLRGRLERIVSGNSG